MSGPVNAPGAGRGRPSLLLVHGWGMGPHCWGAFAEDLGRDFDVHRVALPGHGAAPFEPDWTPGEVAARWLRRHPGAHWVAWSLGALVALEAARLAADAVGRLVLLGATPRFTATDGWPDAMGRETFAAFEADCAANPEATLGRFLGLQVQGAENARTTLRALRRRQADDPAPPRDALLAGLRVLGATDLRGALAQVDRPTLWVTGEADGLAPLAAARAAAGRQPRGRVSSLPGAGHAPFISHERELSALTRRWLQPANP